MAIPVATPPPVPSTPTLDTDHYDGGHRIIPVTHSLNWQWLAINGYRTRMEMPEPVPHYHQGDHHMPVTRVIDKPPYLLTCAVRMMHEYKTISEKHKRCPNVIGAERATKDRSRVNTLRQREEHGWKS